MLRLLLGFTVLRSSYLQAWPLPDGLVLLWPVPSSVSLLEGEAPTVFCPGLGSSLPPSSCEAQRQGSQPQGAPSGSPFLGRAALPAPGGAVLALEDRKLRPGPGLALQSRQ